MRAWTNNEGQIIVQGKTEYSLAKDFNPELSDDCDIPFYLFSKYGGLLDNYLPELVKDGGVEYLHIYYIENNSLISAFIKKDLHRTSSIAKNNLQEIHLYSLSINQKIENAVANVIKALKRDSKIPVSDKERLKLLKSHTKAESKVWNGFVNKEIEKGKTIAQEQKVNKHNLSELIKKLLPHKNIHLLWDVEGEEASKVPLMSVIKNNETGEILWKSPAFYGETKRVKEIEETLNEFLGSKLKSFEINMDNYTCGVYYYGD